MIFSISPHQAEQTSNLFHLWKRREKIPVVSGAEKLYSEKITQIYDKLLSYKEECSEILNSSFSHTITFPGNCLINRILWVVIITDVPV